MLRRNDELFCSDYHNELLRSDRVHDVLLGRMVSRLLGRSRSHADVGFVVGLCRRLPEHVCITEHMLLVPDKLRGRLRSSKLLLELFKLFSVFITMQYLRVVRTGALQLVFVVHRRIRSVLFVWFDLRVQLV